MKWVIGAVVIIAVAVFFRHGRRILEEYEVKLEGDDGWRVKSERKTYPEGHRLKVRIRAPNHVSRVAVLINGESVAEVDVRRGLGRLDLENAGGEGIPVVHSGDTLAIVHDGNAVMEGHYHKD